MLVEANCAHTGGVLELDGAADKIGLLEVIVYKAHRTPVVQGRLASLAICVYPENRTRFVPVRTLSEKYGMHACNTIG